MLNYSEKQLGCHHQEQHREESLCLWGIILGSAEKKKQPTTPSHPFRCKLTVGNDYVSFLMAVMRTSITVVYDLIYK